MINAGSQDLDGHRGTVVQRGPMNNGDRRSTNGRGIEGRKDLREISSELIFNDALDLFKRNKRSGIETGTKFVTEFFAEETRGGRNDLAELHERATRLLEGDAQRERETSHVEGALGDVQELTRGQ